MRRTTIRNEAKERAEQGLILTADEICREYRADRNRSDGMFPHHMIFNGRFF